jgi:hypothetical protein
LSVAGALVGNEALADGSWPDVAAWQQFAPKKAED